MNQVLRLAGLELRRLKPLSDTPEFPIDFDSNEVADVRAVQPYTLTSPERIVSLSRAVKYIVDCRIPGDIVECGVWRGGSMMTIARTLVRSNELNRHLYLFDTFQGMSAPTEVDVGIYGEVASRIWGKDRDPLGGSDYTVVPLELVQQNMRQTQYPESHVHYVKGKVEDTIPSSAPSQIALLRLDTDWYESTMHELVHLFPRLSKGGVIIIDDYGHWEGARRATEEYLSKNGISLLLNRIDYTGRIGVKV